ncbi:MAG: putative ABC transporter permease [Clostridia bacterium]|nr:putative ABC transporter permease [Clostridia bacterium]
MEPTTNRPRRPLPSLWGCTLLFVGISVLGWLFEMIGRYLLYRHVNDRGFLTLPVCPIYGSCVLLAGFLLGSPSSPAPLLARMSDWDGIPRPLRIPWRVFLYFVGATALATLIELFVGLVFRALGIPLWNYAERPGNIAGVICPSYSLLWGVLMTAVMALLWDRLCRLVEKIPRRVAKIAALVSAGLLLGDFLWNCAFVALTGTRFIWM